MTEEDVKYLQERLHSPEMKCRQCNITRALIDNYENPQPLPWGAFPGED